MSCRENAGFEEPTIFRSYRRFRKRGVAHKIDMELQTCMSDNPTLYKICVFNTDEVLMATLAPPASAVTVFPTAAIEACLHDELVETIKSLAKIKGLALPTAPAQIATTSVQIDSLVCIEILCAVEPIVGIELPEKVVKAGGYGSIDAAIKNLIPRIEAEWKKQKGLKP